ncbi:MAG: BMP family ABC transporter substrate-binding protein [Mogibacterium sp.]|nr:BMP family ABC transporter substrate-binding protein [Mogibacterium sp.]MBQ6438848.1 BMP family ABC transporter substrate-binding protein [Mogibacterium sp.]MBQ6500872.1 BMP family ABC transporter substrate-binding protein [Mogibacterium sp.]MBR4092122.1 BMP family ABC transporter substrate-binding protein [Mogibacterium sp.]
MNEEYLKARKAGEKEYKVRLARGEYPYLAALDDILPENGTLQQQSLGLMEIPVEMIAGTKTLARQNSFAPNFMPLLDINTEFSYKWSNLVEAQIKEGFNDPIRVYEYLHRFYVLEGNKRVSVSRFLDMPAIMADVTRIIPTADVLQTEPAYAEFLEFFKAVPVYDMECTRPGAYKEIAEIAGISLDKPWPMDKVRHLQAVYWSFAKVTSELSEKLPEMTMGDAFVVYLRIFRGDAMYDGSEKEVGQRLRQITKELYTQHNNDKVSLVESSDEVLNAGNLINKAEKIIAGPGSLVSKVLPGISYSVNNPLKAAFIYNRCPEHSNWIYNHEAGRLRLEESFGGMVKTARFIADGKNIEGSPESAGSFEEAVAAAVSWGADVVFTTSVQQIDDALRAAIRYKDVKFLNCSINLTHQAVRTYYAKLYEAKFLAGIVAGAAAASDGSHRIGYCSDYPIYGTIAGINAFAIGAAMADPVVQIDLEWSAKQDSNWWWSMVDKGIHVISAIDSTHNTDGSNAYGVCYVERVAPGEGTDLSGTCRITNLAAPIWKWGKLYEIIVKTIIDGTYNARLVDKKDQATNYWWGMISGVVDIELSDEISPYTKQLVDILKSDIICGAMNPFDGDLRSQTGIVRKADDEPLSSMDIITMDWLNENICGEIPVAEALTDEGKATVSVSGIK